MKIKLLKLVDDQLLRLDLEFYEEPKRRFVNTARGRMLKIDWKHKVPSIYKVFEISWTFDYMYIPTKYIKEILQGESSSPFNFGDKWHRTQQKVDYSLGQEWKDIQSKLNGEIDFAPRAKVVSMGFAYRAAA